MLINEATVLSMLLDKLSPSSILDIGSGTRAGREIEQPHIYAAFRGHKVYWSDIMLSPGVLQCDITDKGNLAYLPRCEMVTCLSMLEHVVDIDSALDNLCSLVTKWLVVSAPYNYPEHHCPIDNGWRPSPDELSARVAACGLHVNDMYLTDPETFNTAENVRVSMVLASCPGKERIPC
jgi:hypothetical protein